MLDVKGALVGDNRRTKHKVTVTDSDQDAAHNSISSEAGGMEGWSLKDLMPKRATWIKLDVKGASVEDERCVRRINSSNKGSNLDNKGQYTNLKSLLPERTITWKNKQV